VPIVHKTGGLADTVKLWSPRTGRGTGFAFDNHDESGLRWATQAALATYRDQEQWRQIMHNGMAEDFSWNAQGNLYEQVYGRLAQARAHRS
jgi:starch synthase